MTGKLLGTLEPHEFEDLVDAFIERSEPDALSFDAFDHAAHRLARAAATETIELTGVVCGDSIVFDAAEKAPVIVQGNEVLIGGLRLIVKLRRAQATYA